ncbi:MAG: phospho-N-acetylmuramoyl-pentapeptide-transferase [Bryobacterales bacterium]|nr:phospho-N-acetylmuramoyl-pentapeptide-transferase [Bryobacterales bacterium]
MFYWLLYEQLYPLLSPMRVFQYLTVRIALASLTAMFLCMVLGPFLIRKLRQLQIGQYIREEGPKSHQKKAGTPTMGGVLVVIAIVVSTLLWANLTNPIVWIALFSLVAYGSIGFYDDYMKVTHRRNLGLSSRKKFALQCLIALVICAALMVLHSQGAYNARVNVPFFKQLRPDLLIHSLTDNWYTYPLAFALVYVFLLFVVVGASNGVNLTDGLDGLAIGLMVIAAGAMTALTYISGNADWSRYLDIERVPNVGELTVFCGAMTGASLGFLWYNAHPAEVFMGDVGALSLGGSLGVVAVLIKQEILLLFVGGVFVIETLSVIIQVASFKTTGKRVFKMSPIHHHFEALGWQESKIIARFWIVGIILALTALTTLKIR